MFQDTQQVKMFAHHNLRGPSTSYKK